MSDELTAEEALLLIDALAFNGYVADDGGLNRRLYLSLPYTNWLPTELAQKFTRISERRRADKRREEMVAELQSVKVQAKAREVEHVHEHGDDYTDCPRCMKI